MIFERCILLILYLLLHWNETFLKSFFLLDVIFMFILCHSRLKGKHLQILKHIWHLNKSVGCLTAALESRGKLPLEQI